MGTMTPQASTSDVSNSDVFEANGTNLGTGRDAHAQTIRTPAIHQRAPEGVGRAALVRRDEGRTGSALEVRHPPSHHRAGRARLHSPAAEPGPRHRGDQAARAFGRR